MANRYFGYGLGFRVHRSNSHYTMGQTLTFEEAGRLLMYPPDGGSPWKRPENGKIKPAITVGLFAAGIVFAFSSPADSPGSFIAAAFVGFIMGGLAYAIF